MHVLAVRGRVRAGARGNENNGRGGAVRRHQAVSFGAFLVQTSKHLGLLHGAAQRHGTERIRLPAVESGAATRWLHGIAPAHHLLPKPQPKNQTHENNFVDRMLTNYGHRAGNLIDLVSGKLTLCLSQNQDEAVALQWSALFNPVPQSGQGATSSQE